MLTVSNLSKHFGDLAVFESFSLHLAPNGFTALVGPSGCGKSTLFNVLTGVVEKDSGSVSLQGRDVPHLGTTSAYMHQKMKL